MFFNDRFYGYNFAPVNYLQLPLERVSVFARAGFEFSEAAELYAQGLYADYTADSQAAPTATFFGVLMPPTNPFIPPGRRTSPDVTIVITTRHKGGWEYLECNDTNWLVDGKRLPLPEAQHDGRVSDDGYLLEVIYVSPISVDDLGKLALANRIEYKICNEEHEMSSRARNEIRELARLLPTAMNQ